MQEKNIPVFKPLLEEEEFQAAVDALKLGWLGMGSYVGAFEDGIKNYIGANDRYLAALNTGHSALHVALILCGIQPGDEVITASFNNISDFQAILLAGGTPVLCDASYGTLSIDIDKAEELITPKTKAIIVMDYACHTCDHNKVRDMSTKYGIRVIHDAAHSFGSAYNGQMIGSFSDITMFSFDPIKNLTCIDGGALVVRSKQEFDRIRAMRMLGMEQATDVLYTNARSWTYDVKELGFRYHLANLHAAVGLCNLAKMDVITSTRKRASIIYNEMLSDVNGITTPNTDFEGITPFIYYLLVHDEKRDELRVFLKENRIDTGVHWQPGHWFSLLKNCKKGDLTTTEKIGREIMSVPLYSNIEENVVIHVAEKVIEFFKKNQTIPS
jgi:dTDP-4-amino-4,6-dideoxygalactose transaminase